MPQKTPRVSLVIPAWNEARDLAACLRAAGAQQVPFWEIIVVDNGSDDGTAAIAARFEGVRVLREPRRGIVYARNRGFDAARGDIIARIDADTLLPVDWNTRITAFYGDPAHAGTAWTASGLFKDVPFPALVSGGYRLVAVHINRLLTGYPALWGSSTALPVGLWRAVRRAACSGGGFHEDLDLTVHLHQEGYGIFWDKSVRVEAQLRHAWVPHRELWEYLQWWPRTLQRHGQRSWLLCWLGGALAMYPATLVLGWCQRLKSRLHKKPLETQVPSALEV